MRPHSWPTRWRCLGATPSPCVLAPASGDVRTCEITALGSAAASSTFSGEFPVSNALDGNRATSWFSAGRNADEAGIREGIAKQTLHQRTGPAERCADHSAEQQAGKPDVEDDKCIPSAIEAA